MKDVIELLLLKKASIDEERNAKIAEAVEAIELEFADRAEKIDGLLNMAGYVPPVEEETEVESVESDAEVITEAVNPAEVKPQDVY